VKIELIVFALLFSISLNAQVKFTATAQPTACQVGETIQVQFTLSGTNGGDFKAPSFKGFTVVQGPMRQQMQINSQVSFSFIYVIKADIEGKFTIDPAYITVGGKRTASNTIPITVSKSTAKAQQKSDDATMGKQAEEVIRKNLFMRVSVSKQQVYQGEALVAVYKLYVNPQLALNLSPAKMPSFNGFWSQDIENKEIRYNLEVVDGVNFKVAEIKRVVLLPQQTGTLTVDPIEIEATVRLQVQQQKKQRSMFDDFFDDNRNYKDFPYTVKSKSTTVNVKPLPSNAPQEFKGAVGNLSIKAWLDKTNARTGDAITLKVQVSGEGNLKLLEPIPLNLPPDIEVYEPKTNDNIQITSSGMTGSRTFEYYLIPRNAGEFRIDPVKMAYFDLSKKQYVVLQSQEFNLKVEKGSGGTPSVVAGVKKEDFQLIGKDILFIKTGTPTFNNSGKTLLSLIYYVLFIMPAILFLIFFIYRKKREELYNNQDLLKNRKAHSTARKRLVNAKKIMDKGDEVLFNQEISRVLWGYASDKLSIPIAELTKDKAIENLNKRNVNSEVIDNLIATIQYSEMARFARESEKMPLIDVYTQAETVIIDLEGILK
jgi:hypothetical protein